MSTHTAQASSKDIAKLIEEATPIYTKYGQDVGVIGSLIIAITLQKPDISSDNLQYVLTAVSRLVCGMLDTMTEDEGAEESEVQFVPTDELEKGKVN